MAALSTDLYNIDVTRSHGRYDEKDKEEEDIVFCHLKCNDEETTAKKKRVNCIFVIDLSGSMSSSIRMLQSSLLAFRDVIISSDNTSTETTSEKDEKFRKLFNFQLIGFNDNASVIYRTSDTTETFDDAVSKYVSASGFTNIYDALDLAFSNVQSSEPTIICLLSDGEPNRGKLQTTESLRKYVSTQKDDRIIEVFSIGFGHNIKADLLEAIGSFSYIETNESIPQVFGNIALQSQTSFGWNAKLELVSDTNDEVQPIPEESLITGTNQIGTLYSGRTFAFAIPSSILAGATSLRLSYYDPSACKM